MRPLIVRLAARALAAAVIVVILALARRAEAAITLGVTPIWKESRTGWQAWNVVAVTITNPGSAAVKGRIDIDCVGCRYGAGKPEVSISSAPFIVQAASAVVVRAPTAHVTGQELKIRAIADTGQVLAETSLAVSPASMPLLVEMSPPRIAPVLAGANITVVPTERWASPGPRAVYVGLVEQDLVTGDPVMPERVAEYGPVTALVMPSDVLSRLGGQELEALAAWVLSGGTLAVAVKRPEDLRSPVLVAMLGGEAASSQGAPHLRSLSSLELDRPAALPGGAAPPPPMYDEDGEMPVPAVPPPTKPGTKPKATKTLLPASKTVDGFVSYTGGNLVASDFGATAAYGLGEVHLLPFDPTTGGVCDDPWVVSRLGEMTAHAWNRRVAHLVGPGMVRKLGVANDLASELDVVQQSRWTLILSMMLLITYAIVAGPVLFGVMKGQKKPLRVLWMLPLASGATFLLVVGIGVLGRGVSGGSRHLSLLETGGGMAKGAVRRHRALLYPAARELTARALDATGSPTASLREQRGLIVVERAGLRVGKLDIRPWETVIVREDSAAGLGDGVALVREGKEVRVTNRTGRALRGVIVHVPRGGYVHFPRIADRESVVTGLHGKKAVGSPHTAGTGQRVLGADAFATEWSDTPGLESAVRALEHELSDGRPTDAWPDDLPVLLGQLDGGEGVLSDTGLDISSDRVIVRVVGFGGAP